MIAVKHLTKFDRAKATHTFSMWGFSAFHTVKYFLSFSGYIFPVVKLFYNQLTALTAFK